MKPRLLDLFCGAGGAAMGYALAGFEVLGVDHRAQPHYPFEFVRADALRFLAELEPSGFAAIHASPPCKRWTVARRVHAVLRPSLFERDEDLLAPTRAALQAIGLPFVIENVPGAPLEDPTLLCGSMFGLEVRRHRLFETNWALAGRPCRHDQQPHPVGVYGDGGAWTRTAPGGGGRKVSGADAARALGITWTTHQPALAQAIPPAYTEYIGERLLAETTKAGPPKEARL